MPSGIYIPNPFTEKLRREKISKTMKGRMPKFIPDNKGRKKPSFSGENHPNWIKDRNLVKHQDEKNNARYKQWRYECKKRDNFQCKMKNKDCSGKIIIHHILGWTVFPELRYEINNGITLCQFHHPLKRVEEKRLIPFFQSMVEVI